MLLTRKLPIQLGHYFKRLEAKVKSLNAFYGVVDGFEGGEDLVEFGHFVELGNFTGEVGVEELCMVAFERLNAAYEDAEAGAVNPVEASQVDNDVWDVPDTWEGI